MRRTSLTFLVLLSMLSNTVLAKVGVASALAYGNQNQPGTRLHQQIQSLMQNGDALIISSELVVNKSLIESSAVLSSSATITVNADKRSTIEFMRNMVATNSLFEATKATIESTPEKIIHIINLVIALYPKFAKEVVYAAIMTGKMKPEQALIAAINAGADPTIVGEATAAGSPVVYAAFMTGEMDTDQALLDAIIAGADPTAVGEATAAGGPVIPLLSAPVGVGVGAGGTGGGDITASTN